MTSIVCLVFTLITLSAQESQTDYNFLHLPASAHVGGLGGDNISIINDDASLMFSNPALVSCVSDKTINLNFMTYMQGSVTGSASFTKIIGKRSTLGIGAQFIDYGSMKETNADNVELGNFSASDFALSGVFAYNLTDRIVGGVTAKAIYSHIGSYNSFAMGVDLGLNYFNENSDFSASIVARNLGGQLKAYDDTYEAIPFNMSVGITKRLKGAPFRPSVTFIDITDWTYDKLLEHIIIGTDVLLGNTIYICAAYNFKRAEEMKLVDESTHGAGWSFGGGLELQKFKLQMAYAKYHVSSSSFLINISYSL
ncbi:MAG: type IX secretion system protein PorQ [Bacteroidaceae bacterium]|nr:type IX secretion system protein PorQ [Bacteroidaceae bacterium]